MRIGFEFEFVARPPLPESPQEVERLLREAGAPALDRLEIDHSADAGGRPGLEIVTRPTEAREALERVLPWYCRWVSEHGVTHATTGVHLNFDLPADRPRLLAALMLLETRLHGSTARLLGDIQRLAWARPTGLDARELARLTPEQVLGEVLERYRAVRLRKSGAVLEVRTPGGADWPARCNRIAAFARRVTAMIERLARLSGEAMLRLLGIRLASARRHGDRLWTATGTELAARGADPLTRRWIGALLGGLLGRPARLPSGRPPWRMLTPSLLEFVASEIPIEDPAVRATLPAPLRPVAEVLARLLLARPLRPQDLAGMAPVTGPADLAALERLRILPADVYERVADVFARRGRADPATIWRLLADLRGPGGEGAALVPARVHAALSSPTRRWLDALARALDGSSTSPADRLPPAVAVELLRRVRPYMSRRALWRLGGHTLPPPLDAVAVLVSPRRRPYGERVRSLLDARLAPADRPVERIARHWVIAGGEP